LNVPSWYSTKASSSKVPFLSPTLSLPIHRSAGFRRISPLPNLHAILIQKACELPDCVWVYFIITVIISKILEAIRIAAFIGVEYVRYILSGGGLNERPCNQ